MSLTTGQRDRLEAIRIDYDAMGLMHNNADADFRYMLRVLEQMASLSQSEATDSPKDGESK